MDSFERYISALSQNLGVSVEKDAYGAVLLALPQPVGAHAEDSCLLLQTYRADTTKGDNTVALTLVVKQRVAGMNARGEQIMENHPIYRISKITINSDFDPTKTISSNSLVQYDTTEYNYIKILYVNKMYIRKEVLVNALRISPYLLYNQKELTQTYNNIRALGYTANISFTPAPEDKGAAPVMVTIAGADGGDISTSEQLLECLIQLNAKYTTEYNPELGALNNIRLFFGRAHLELSE